MPSEAVNIIIGAKDNGATSTLARVKGGVQSVGEVGEKAQASFGKIAAVFASLRYVAKLLVGDFEGIRAEVDAMIGIPLSEKVDEWAASFSRWRGDVVPTVERVEVGVNSLSARLDRLAEKEKERERFAALRERQEQQRIADINKINDSLARQVDVLGMTADQIAIYDLKTRNATEADIWLAENLIEKRRRFEEAAEAAREATLATERQEEVDRRYIEALRAQFIEMTQGAAAARRYKDELAGVSRETIAQGDAIRAQIDAMQSRAEMQREANELLRQYQTPLEEFEQKYEQIIRLVAAGRLEKAAARNIRDQLVTRFQEQQGSAERPQADNQLAPSEARFLRLGRGGGASESEQQLDVAKRTQQGVERLTQIMAGVEAAAAATAVNTKQQFIFEQVRGS